MDGCRDHQRRVSKGGKRVGRMEIGWGKKGQVLVVMKGSGDEGKR